MKVVCRFCLKEDDLKHCFGLFNKQGLENNLPERLSKLLELPVEPSSYLPSHMCRTCKTALVSIEDKTVKYRERAAKSYEV